MNIDGLGVETVELLYKEGLIENYADLYDLKIDQIIPLERMAQKSAENLIMGIEDSKSIPFEKVLFALGIRFVGETVAKKIAQYFKNIDRIMMASYEELISVDEIGERIAASIIDFFNNEYNRSIIARLKDHRLQFEIEEEEKISEMLKGKVFVVSGVFDIFSREELKQSIEANAGKVGSSISKKTDYVIAGANMGPAKLEKAKSLEIPIISEQDYLKMIQSN